MSIFIFLIKNKITIQQFIASTHIPRIIVYIIYIQYPVYTLMVNNFHKYTL